MRHIVSEAELECLLRENPATLLLFGGQDCGVCQAIKPQLEQLTREEFPKLAVAYIDCQQEGGVLCAARGIFALPVVQLWFEGRHFETFAKVFSLGQIRNALKRPYGLLFGTDAGSGSRPRDPGNT